MSDKYIAKGKSIIFVSIIIIMISIGLRAYPTFFGGNDDLSFEYVNIKDISSAKVTDKNDTFSKLAILNFGNRMELGTLEEVYVPQVKAPEPKRIWYLPTEMGVVSQYPSYSHMAYDITSPRGSSENIFPVANGVISGIYRDNAGALIVTIRHDINGVIYTSQYVHLSQYADGLYVGKPVTINDCIGRMGTTGISTGVHLHVTVLDNCNLFGSGSSCNDLGSFFRYGKQRISQGYLGLGSVINVPPSWTSR